MYHNERNSKGKFVKKGVNKRVQNLKRGQRKPNEIHWDEGKRIVDLGLLAKELEKCKGEGCNLPLQLSNTDAEFRSGFGSVLSLVCPCGAVNKVKTSNIWTNKENGTSFDVNLKAATAAIHSGMTYAELERFSSTLDIPPPHEKRLKRNERKIGPALENIAKESCQSAKKAEEAATSSACNTVDLTASYDMGWQRRSGGRAYNSNSGHGVLVGANTDRILEYGSRIKNCKQCEVNVRQGTTKEHDCRMNWGGSSKAMEADLAVELIEKSTTSSSRVSNLICDEDASTIFKIRDQIDPDIRKISDRNHIRKNIGNDLYALQKIHKILQPKVISYLQKCFCYAVKQNEGKPEETKWAILNIVPHVFGEHQNCGTWCKFREDSSRQFENLPYKKPLSGTDLRSSLERIFCKNAANASNICTNASSNSNESFNNIVASKARKSCHFSKSESFDLRLASAVCQKNISENYVEKVFDSLALSPGKVRNVVASQIHKKFQKRKLKNSTVEAKRRRIMLKQNRNELLSQVEVREGTTYQTSLTLDPIPLKDTQQIPPATILSPVEFIDIKIINEDIICIFDLETTSLSDDCDIVQISAITLNGEYVFNQYILPDIDISFHASKITGITMIRPNIFFNGKAVESVDIKEALLRFSNFLSTFNKNVTMLGHNVKCFDIKHLHRHILACGLQENFRMISGFVDTLPLYKSLYPRQTSFSLENLYSSFVGGNYRAHNALDDVKAFSSLIDSTIIDKSIFSKFSMTWKWSMSYVTFLKNKRFNFQTFHFMISSGAISKGMAERAAASGLSSHHLQLAFERKEETGLVSLLSEKFNDVPRVTKSKKVISSIVDFFRKQHRKPT